MIIKNQNPNDYHYIIFDLDGTLVDSSPDITETIKYITKLYGFKEKSDAFIRSCIGGGSRKVLLRVFGDDKEALIDTEILPLYVRRYTENCHKNVLVYPGVKEILRYYKEQGKALSLATFKI